MNLPSQDLKDILEASGLGLVHKTNLFIGSEPVLPPAVTTIYDTPGFAPDDTLTKGESVYRPAIQIKVRNPSYVAAGVLVNQIKDVLHLLAGETWNGSTYILIRCDQEPFCLGFTENNLAMWVCNFSIQRQ
ncbi:MAG: hypothetical protein D4R73_05940 [Deltaproteobacteria bacterium]|nr:MAG: hypothetical protein D4R73_05940 [Deltaproteobacteria bacterium]